ncbi:glycine cleavage system protein GcvH [Carnobacterium gallinarum]|uniref:glycine cleavage system protein GcvH n=1 Tax=Carnobacterium gallinarum TaxID=2749 RepID=UPI0005533BEA|nr:glycine cleavage system protein GcvH [Carnobacterium gallinarum]
MTNPKELLYTKEHEWIQFLDADKKTAKVGITDFAQSALGDIVFMTLPESGDQVTKGDQVADVESVKAVSNIYTPVTGTVTKVNEEIIDNPAELNTKPYQSWLFEVKEITDTTELLDSEAYEKVVLEEE